MPASHQPGRRASSAAFMGLPCLQSSECDPCLVFLKKAPMNNWAWSDTYFIAPAVSRPFSVSSQDRTSSHLAAVVLPLMRWRHQVYDLQRSSSSSRTNNNSNDVEGRIDFCGINFVFIFSDKLFNFGPFTISPLESISINGDTGTESKH